MRNKSNPLGLNPQRQQSKPIKLEGLPQRLLLAALGLALMSCSSTEAPKSTADKSSPAASAPSPAPTTSASAPSTTAPSPTAGGDKSESTKLVEAEIVKVLSPKIPSPITAANCPNVEKVETGATVNCTATIAEGTFPVVVTFTSASDANFSPKKLLNLAAIEQKIVEAVKSQKQTDVKADCGGKVKVFQEVGDTFECNLVTPDGKTGKASVVVKTLEGNVSFETKDSQ